MDFYDHRRSRYRDYPREDDRDVERRRPYKRRHRFDKYRVTGMLIMFFAVSIFVLGIFDIGWTTSRYGNNCQYDLSNEYPNLCFGSHFYVYIGSPLWGGAWLIIVAFVSLGIHPDKERHRRAHKNFLIMLGISLVLIAPAIIVLNVLEVYNGLNYYWKYDSEGNLTSIDFLQFGLPIAIVIMAGMVLNVILFFCVFLYCCREDNSYDKSSRYRERERERERERDYDARDEPHRGRHWSHDPYRNYNRDRGSGFSGVYGGGNGGHGTGGGYARRFFYN